MDGVGLEGLRAIAVRVATEAAGTAGRLREAAIQQVRTKTTHTDVVTAADTEVERLLRDRLAELRPDDLVLGEEGGFSAGQPAGQPGDAGDRLCWVVDPIDGTVNYIYGLPWYTVSVGVTRNGESLAGAVVEPPSGRVWSASLGGGASLDGVPLRASATRRLDLALIGTGFSYHRDRRVRQGELATALMARVRDIRRAGCASLDLCAVAAGWLDGYYEHGVHPWDWAAGALIAREAGAVVHLPDPSAPFGEAIVAAAPGIGEPFAAALGELGAAAI